VQELSLFVDHFLSRYKVPLDVDHVNVNPWLQLVFELLEVVRVLQESLSVVDE
jgi:hypothetical protein